MTGEILINEAYIDFLKTMFSLLLVVGLCFSTITGGVCAYCCKRSFCRATDSKNGLQQREAHTIDM